MGRQARDLQRDLLRTRMVGFENISERLCGVVRQAAKFNGKPVKSDITGGAIEMDRGVLDRMGQKRRLRGFLRVNHPLGRSRLH